MHTYTHTHAMYLTTITGIVTATETRNGMNRMKYAEIAEN